MSSVHAGAAMRLVEECTGIGRISWREHVIDEVAYDVRRFQGFAPSGMPVPGVHRIEGQVSLENRADAVALVDAVLTLHLEDGRSLRVQLVDGSGRILAVGHGPSRCACC